jgi:hypothetical protein
VAQVPSTLFKLISMSLAGDRTGFAREFWLRQLAKLLNRCSSMNCSRYEHSTWLYGECVKDGKEMLNYIIEFAKLLRALRRSGSSYIIELNDMVIQINEECAEVIR